MSLDTRSRERLIFDGAALGEHLVERYYRTWTGDSPRVYRQEKLAVQMDEFDEQLNGRLGNLDWDTFHCTWDDDYQPHFSDDSGAWTIDGDDNSHEMLEMFGVYCGPLDGLPLVGEVSRFAVSRECPHCGYESVCSSRDLDAFPSWTDSMRIARESVEITHVCTTCHRWLEAR